MNQMICIRCDKKLESSFPSSLESDNEWPQPYGGTTFEAYGHYGSTIFDPMDGSHLIIELCDPCIIELSKQSKIILSDNNNETFEIFTPTESEIEWVNKCADS